MAGSPTAPPLMAGRQRQLEGAAAGQQQACQMGLHHWPPPRQWCGQLEQAVWLFWQQAPHLSASSCWCCRQLVAREEPCVVHCCCSQTGFPPQQGCFGRAKPAQITLGHAHLKGFACVTRGQIQVAWGTPPGLFSRLQVTGHAVHRVHRHRQHHLARRRHSRDDVSVVVCVIEA